MKLHDNHSFEEKREAGLDHHEGEIVIPFEAYGVNESDIILQLFQTMEEMTTQEISDTITEIEVREE